MSDIETKEENIAVEEKDISNDNVPSNDIPAEPIPSEEEILAKISDDIRTTIRKFIFEKTASEPSDEEVNGVIKNSYTDALSKNQKPEEFLDLVTKDAQEMKKSLEFIDSYKATHSSRAEEDFQIFADKEWGKESKIVLEKAEEYLKKESGLSLSDINPSKRKEVVKHLKEQKLVLNKAVDLNTAKIPEINKPKEIKSLSPRERKIQNIINNLISL